MPWKIENQEGKHCVVAEETGETVKCHDSEEDAKAHMQALYANTPDAAKSMTFTSGGLEYSLTVSDATKAGARHSKLDQSALQTAHDALVAAGARCETPEPAAKATGLDMAYTTYNTPPLAIKIAGEMELDVCYMPYSGQRGGKDADGQYFSPRTNEHAEKFPTPLVLYYHGYEERGKPAPMPIEIGKPTGKKWQDRAGRWLRVALEKGNQKAETVWASAQKGNARASSDSVAHLVRVADDGEILNWPFVGISVFETETGKRPANSYAFALPAAKALGINIPPDEDDNEELKQVAAAIAATVLQLME